MCLPLVFGSEVASDDRNGQRHGNDAHVHGDHRDDLAEGARRHEIAVATDKALLRGCGRDVVTRVTGKHGDNRNALAEGARQHEIAVATDTSIVTWLR